MALTTGILFGFVALFSFAIQDILLKKLMSKVNPCTLIFYRGISITIILVIYALFTGNLALPVFDSLVVLLLIGIIGAVSYIFYLKGVEKGLVSIVNPIAKSSVILTVILSIIFFNERLTGLNVFGIGLIIIGTIATSVELEVTKGGRRKEHLVRGAKYALLASAGWGVLFFLYKIPVVISGPIVTSVYFEMFAFIFASMIIVPMRAVKSIGRDVLPSIIIIAMVGAVGTLSISTALTTENVSIMIPITNATPLLLVILGWMLLRERPGKPQILGILLISVGLLFVVG